MDELQNDFEESVFPVEESETDISLMSTVTTKYNEIKDAVLKQKKSVDELTKLTKDFEKILNKLAKKASKSEEKLKQPRKPCGFAVPRNVSNDLCAFMGRETGSKIARTDVNKFLSAYISENQLHKPENKQIILPDDELLRLLGEEAKNQKLTHFNIQKYMNKHFEKSGRSEQGSGEP